MADLVIRGMEMPETCGLCQLCLDDSRICNGYCMFFHRRVNMMERDKNCPIIPLPEGHGDLIDRDAFLADNGLGKDCENCDRNTRNCNYDICLSRMDVCGWIDDAPTIVPAEGGTDDG